MAARSTRRNQPGRSAPDASADHPSGGARQRKPAGSRPEAHASGSPEKDALREALGYLNFSSGTPDPAFQRNFNRLCGALGVDGKLAGRLKGVLLEELEDLQGTSPAFSDVDQARAVIEIGFERALPAYRRHHADLLFHLKDEDFQQPFFLVRVLEAVLEQGSPWDEADRVIAGVLERLNDFLGYRPLAVLENGRQMQPYSHERYRPVPLYIREAGVACGRYRELLERAIAFFRETPADLQQQAHFDVDLMDELCVDVRAHDHLHPMNKRTNYMFGEWDPHVIDTKGRYRRFVIRQIILDALLDWIETQQKKVPVEEVLYDASAVLCGTMLMASAISGSGPETHDSTVSLTSLLPVVARQRDVFYERLLSGVSGERGRRLRREAEVTRQPFGHVRQHLNIQLAGHGARQVQHRHLVHLYARMGYGEAAREQAAAIPTASVRFECEIGARLAAAQRELDAGRLEHVARLVRELEDHLHRGIECGAIVDPWNILGFQGQFPLFTSREDSIPDERIEVLLGFVEHLFEVYSRALGEAAAQGDKVRVEEFTERMRLTAQWWEQFAAPTIEDLEAPRGEELWRSARCVAAALAEWRAAGESSGAISFWRQHVEEFDSAAAYGRVVDTLLEKRDHVAAMGLMMQWLSEADEVGLESGPYSMHALLVRWLKLVLGGQETGDRSQGSGVKGQESEDEDRGSRIEERAQGRPSTQSLIDNHQSTIRTPLTTHHSPPADDPWPAVRRLFDYLEANAGEYWSVPTLDEATTGVAVSGDDRDEFDLPAGFFDDDFDDEEDDDGDLFEAAYEGMVYRDSAADGIEGDTIDEGYSPLNTEFELIVRQLEPRLRFIQTLARLWQIAAARIAGQRETNDGPREAGESAERLDVIRSWRDRVQALQKDLIRLMGAVSDYELSTTSGDVDANVEYDMQLQTRFYLLHVIITTCVACRTAERLLFCCLPAGEEDPESRGGSRPLVELYRSILARDVVAVRRQLPGLLKRLSRQPLLYVSLENDGDPREVLAAKHLQSIMTFLLAQLPRLGLLRETWQTLQTAFRMERVRRPDGVSVTEFDRLFSLALGGSLECVARSAAGWDGSDGSTKDDRDADLVDMVDAVVERYLRLWLKHSRSVRLSPVEALQQESLWKKIRRFIEDYGGDLFHTRMLMLGNVRAILHIGVGEFLEHLSRERDPLRPIALLDDLEEGLFDYDDAHEFLELIYEIVVDKLDRFIEYNTTTTQSDYGEKFYCLLDFLRVEAEYERDAWNLQPVRTAHEVLSRLGRTQAALMWEESFREKTAATAKGHIRRLRSLEKKHGMRLPSLADRLEERFVKPLAVDRMLALIPRAMQDARESTGRSKKKGRLPAFQTLRREIERYLKSTSGSAIDVPDWLRTLDQEVERFDSRFEPPADEKHADLAVPPVQLRRRQLEQQLEDWARSQAEKE